MEETLLYFSLKYQGNFNSIYKALETKEKVDENLKNQLLRQINSHYTTMVSKDYPQRFKSMDYPPFVVFYYGDLSLLDSNTIAVIGTNEPTLDGEEVTEKFVKEFVEMDLAIVSSLDLGIQSLAQEITLQNNGKSIAYLPCGIEISQPKINQILYEDIKEKALLISEYPNTTPFSSDKAVQRDRLIAGSSDCLLLTELRDDDCILPIVGNIMMQKKEVFCVPNHIHGLQGTNEFIKRGCTLFNDSTDIIKYQSHGKI